MAKLESGRDDLILIFFCLLERQWFQFDDFIVAVRRSFNLIWTFIW